MGENSVFILGLFDSFSAMHPKAHTLIQKIQETISNSALSIPIQNALMAELLVLIAEDMDTQTRRLIRLTWALVIVSVALLLFSIVQLVVTLK